MNYFTDKKIFITGGSRGVGLSIVKELSVSGCSILSVQRSRHDFGMNNISSLRCDLSSKTSVELLIKKIDNNFDCLIFNASYFLHTDYDKYTEKQLQECLNVNLISTIILCKALINKLNKGGSIVIISSTSTRTNYPGSSIYSATQAAIESYAKTLAKELAPDIRVNVVAPGVTDTDLLANSIKEGFTPEIEKLRKNIPLQKIAKPKDISNAVIFLLSDKASHITGQVLSVNGGSYI